MTERAGLRDSTSKSLGIALLDYDDDGWLDLLVTNDTQPNKLYRNNHNGTFTDVAVQAGVAYSDAGSTRAGMGVDNGDYENSGHPGVVIGNFTNEGIALYRTDGSGLYTSASEATGIDRWSLQSLTFSTFFFDYDLDGLLDVLAVNGHVADDISVTQPHLKYAEPALVFRNKGRGLFENMSTRLGSALQRPIVGRGAAYGDFDNDGDLDLVITEANGPARLLRNENGNQNDLLRVKVVGTRSNRDGIGAKLTLQVDPHLRLLRMVKTGSGYLSQSELPVTFGLGKPDPTRRMRLTILWPSGHKDFVSGIEPNQSITVQEGKGIIAAHAIIFHKAAHLEVVSLHFERVRPGALIPSRPFCECWFGASANLDTDRFVSHPLQRTQRMGHPPFRGASCRAEHQRWLNREFVSFRRPHEINRISAGI